MQAGKGAGEVSKIWLPFSFLMWLQNETCSYASWKKQLFHVWSAFALQGMANVSLNKTPWYLKAKSYVIRHVIGWLFILLEHLVLAVFGNEAEARWDGCSCVSSWALSFPRTTDPWGSPSLEHSHSRDSLPAHGRQGEILVLLGNQLSLVPSVTPW